MGSEEAKKLIESADEMARRKPALQDLLNNYRKRKRTYNRLRSNKGDRNDRFAKEPRTERRFGD